MNIETTIFLFLLGATHLNLIIAIVARAKGKYPGYNDLVYYWVGMLLTYLAAALLRETETLIAFSLFFHIIPLLIISKIFHRVGGIPFHLKHYLLFYALMGLSSGSLLTFGVNFSLALMPLCLSLSYPLLSPVYQVTKLKIPVSWPQKLLMMLFVLGAIHIFNFAIFRLDPANAWWGWSISLAQYQAISILMPIMIYQQKLDEERLLLGGAIRKLSGQEDLKSLDTPELYQALLKEIEEKYKLTQELQEKNHLLQEEKEVIDKLFKTVTHDLANPVMVISAYLNMMKSGRIPHDNFLETIEKIKNNTDSALVQINKVREGIIQRRPPGPL